MLLYVARKVLYAIPTLIGVSIVTFVLFYLTATPEQMARRNLSAKNPTPKQIQGWVKEHGYDKPKSEQLKKHLSELFLLRLGKSDKTNEPISDRLKAGAPVSGLISFEILLGGLISAICFALIAGYYRGTYLDNYITLICVLNISIAPPVYIITGQVLLGKLLKYFPLGGYRGGLDAWKFITMPGLLGIIIGLGAGVRLYRTFMLDEMNQDYVRTARAKGVGERTILFRHVLRNAAIPIITTIVLNIPFIFLGNLLLENFFGIPGLGNITADAITNQDFATIRAIVFLGTILYIIGSIFTDVMYAVADPRIRLEAR